MTTDDYIKLNDLNKRVHNLELKLDKLDQLEKQIDNQERYMTERFAELHTKIKTRDKLLVNLSKKNDLNIAPYDQT